MLLTTFLSKSKNGPETWQGDRLSKEASRSPVYRSEEKTNLQSLRGIPHKERTTEASWVSINMTSFPRILDVPAILTLYVTHSSPQGYTLIAKFHHSPPWNSKTWQHVYPLHSGKLEMWDHPYFPSYFINYSTWITSSLPISLCDSGWLSFCKVFSPTEYHIWNGYYVDSSARAICLKTESNAYSNQVIKYGSLLLVPT